MYNTFQSQVPTFFHFCDVFSNSSSFSFSKTFLVNSFCLGLFIPNRCIDASTSISRQRDLYCIKGNCSLHTWFTLNLAGSSSIWVILCALFDLPPKWWYSSSVKIKVAPFFSFFNIHSQYTFFHLIIFTVPKALICQASKSIIRGWSKTISWYTIFVIVYRYRGISYSWAT